MKKLFKKWWFWVIIVFLLIVGASIDQGEEKTSGENKDPVNADVETSNDDPAESETEGEQANIEQKEDKDESEEEEEPIEEDKPEEVELTPQEEMVQKLLELMETGDVFDTGSYTQGDISAGEYAFVKFEGAGNYYGEEDLSGNIIDNENFSSFGYVHVHDKGNITTQGVLVNINSFEKLGVSGAKELFEIVNGIENYLDAGFYKVGVDIEPGQYKLESYGDAYVAVLSGPVGNNEIINNELFNGSYTVNVTEGQYLQINNASIVK